MTGDIKNQPRESPTPEKPAENAGAKKKRGKPFPKGHAGPGRPKGCKNTVTVLRDMFMDAIHEMGAKEFLKRAARRRPDTLINAVARMLPQRMEVEASLNVEFPDNAVKPGRAGIDALDAPDAPKTAAGEE